MTVWSINALPFFRYSIHLFWFLGYFCDWPHAVIIASCFSHPFFPVLHVFSRIMSSTIFTREYIVGHQMPWPQPMKLKHMLTIQWKKLIALLHQTTILTSRTEKLNSSWTLTKLRHLYTSCSCSLCLAPQFPYHLVSLRNPPFPCSTAPPLLFLVRTSLQCLIIICCWVVIIVIAISHA